MGRPPLSTQERAQIRALLRFLIIVLMAIAFASASVGLVLTLINNGQTPPLEVPLEMTATP